MNALRWRVIMDAREREVFKEQLRAMAAGRGEGIDLASVDRWAIPGLEAPVPFFQHLSLLLPANSILYFEGSDIHAEVVRFYESNRARNAVAVVRDMIFPIPETFHVSATPAVSTGSSQCCHRHFVARHQSALGRVVGAWDRDGELSLRAVP